MDATPLKSLGMSRLPSATSAAHHHLRFHSSNNQKEQSWSGELVWPLGAFLELTNVDDFKIFSLVQPPTVRCTQAGPSTCLHFSQWWSFLTKHVAKINVLLHSLPPISSQAVSCQKKEYPLVFFDKTWAALGTPIKKNPRGVGNNYFISECLNCSVYFLQGIRAFTSGHNIPSEISAVNPEICLEPWVL